MFLKASHAFLIFGVERGYGERNIRAEAKREVYIVFGLVNETTWGAKLGSQGRYRGFRKVGDEKV